MLIQTGGYPCNCNDPVLFPKDVREQYEHEIKKLQEAYGEVRQYWNHAPEKAGYLAAQVINRVQQGLRKGGIPSVGQLCC